VAEHTSARAALDLQRLGITNVKALLGGWNQWVADKNPVAKGEKP
jgi:3-mercaptopyruvate sulfurtransferase SseA